MPAQRKKADPMVARLKKVEIEQKKQEGWQTKHQKECLEVYTQIRAATAVLPDMKKQLDAQDELLDVIRNGQDVYKIGRKIIVILVAIIGGIQGLIALGQWLLSHWQ